MGLTQKELVIMAEGQTYDIPETMLPWFREKIEKLGKKAERLVGEKVYCTVIGYHFLDGEGHHHKLQKMKIYEVFVAHPEVKLNGWQFVARIDHSQEAGNVVRVVPGMTLPERYRASTRHTCDHCNERRYRRDTFVLKNVGTDDYKQVGSSCLKDFTGHNGADKLSKIAEMLAIIGDYSRGIGFGGSGEHIDYRWLSTGYFAALVAQAISTHGWTSVAASKEHRLTATVTRAVELAEMHATPSANAVSLANQAMAWAEAFGDDGAALNDWQHNCRTVAQSEALEHRHLSIAASIVGVFWSKFVKPPYVERISNYVGRIGDKLLIHVTLKAAIPGERSTRHIFEDDNGNVLIWFAFNEHLGADGFTGKELQISATVKNHQEFRGKKQTLISRVRVVGAMPQTS
jgi:hypothetical protein